MSVDNPRTLLLAALAANPPLSRLELHALLFRLAGRWKTALRNRLEPVWAEELGMIRRQTSRLIGGDDWLSRLREQARWIQEDQEGRALLSLAALLQVLDEHHRTRRRDIGLASAEVPAAFGGGRCLFVSPPANPIADRISQAEELRGRDDLGNDLRETLSLWWTVIDLDRHAIEPVFSSLDARTSRELDRRLREEGDLRIGLASPFAHLGYVIRSDAARCGGRGIPYRFAELEPDCLDEARAGLAKILASCAEHRIDVLCFPELTLDASLFQDLRSRLKLHNPTRHPLLVMAGSFHCDSDDGWVNRCRLLGPTGAVLSSHDKCVAFGLRGPETTRELRATLGIDERGGYEDIYVSNRLPILDSALGRLATPICLDFCGEELRGLLIESCVNLFLVPAMTAGLSRFQKMAETFGDHNRASTFVVNSAWLLRRVGIAEPEPKDLLVAYLPGKKLPKTARKLADSPDFPDPLYLCSISELLGSPGGSRKVHRS